MLPLKGLTRLFITSLQGDCRPDALFVFNNLMIQGVVMAIHDAWLALA